MCGEVLPGSNSHHPHFFLAPGAFNLLSSANEMHDQLDSGRMADLASENIQLFGH